MVKASITLDGIVALTPEQIRAIGRKALRAVGRRWIDTMLPIHFTNAAFSKYGYQPRNEYYRRRKRTRREITGVTPIGEDKPLVWTGRSREGAQRARFKLENSGSTTTAAGEVIINAPALNFRPTGSTINMLDEVTRVTQ